MAIKTIEVAKSVFAATALTLDSGKRPDYRGYPMFGVLLDMDYVRETVILASRQVGKSIFVATRAVVKSLIPYHKYVYIAPSEKQAKDFSRMKLGRILEDSKLLKKFLMSRNSPLLPPGESATLNMLANDVFYKSFANSSSIKIGYAADAQGVDRVRGGTANELTVDEAQNTDLSAIMPVLRPMLDEADRTILNVYGTPLNEHDSLVTRFRASTQHTAVVKCEACNRWTTLDTFRVIGLHGLICPHCGRPIDARKAQFIPMNPNSDILGVHINRLMLRRTVSTDTQWAKLLASINDPSTSEDKATQEILGRPSGTSSEMISEEDVAKAATLPPRFLNKTFSEVVNEAAKSRTEANKRPYILVHAMDWGGGSQSLSGAGQASTSRTAEVLLGLHLDKGYVGFDLLYHKLFPLAHPRQALDTMLEHMGTLPGGSIIASDALGGTFAISTIRDFLATLGRQLRFLPIQLGSLAEGTAFKDLDDRITVSKTNALTKFFTALIHGKFALQDDPNVLREITKQFLSETEFSNEIGKRLWRKKEGFNDDILLSVVFGFVAASYFHERALMH